MISIPYGERVIGLVLLIIAAVLLIAAVLIGWSAINRWRAIASISDHHMARLSDKEVAARSSAKAAAQLLPGDAATALPDIDPSSEQAIDLLERLARQVPVQQRSLVATTLAFASVLAGKGPGDGLEGPDAVLLSHLAALHRGELPTFPEWSQGTAPSMAIYSRTAQAHTQAAWNAGKAEDLRLSLGALALLRPKHAEAIAMQAVLAAVNPNCGKVVLLAALAALGDQQLAWARRLAVFAPTRAAVILEAIPLEKRTSDESQQMLVGDVNGTDLARLVDLTMAAPGEAAMISAFVRCVKENQLGLAAKLVERAPTSIKRDLQFALAYRKGDFVTVSRLDPKSTDLRPTMTTPITRSGMIAFHISTPSGVQPTMAELTVQIDGKFLEISRVKRWGSLVMIQITGTGVLKLDVHIGATLLFTEKIKV